MATTPQPYEPPQADLIAPPPVMPSATQLVRFVMISAAITVVASLAQSAIEFVALALGWNLHDTTVDLPSFAAFAAVTLLALAALVVLLGWSASLIGFLCWIHRATRIARALNSMPTTLDPSWAVAGFFIPFLNFYWPYLAVKELWQTSDPSAPTNWKDAPVTPVVFLWWPVFLGHAFISLIGLIWTVADWQAESPATAWVSAGLSALMAVPAGLFYWIVGCVHARQRARGAPA
ncbi:MAG: DUF4328 domain-containing protein [Acidobacteriota bacterium]